MIKNVVGVVPAQTKQRIVTTGMNLADTANERLSQMLGRKAQRFVDTPNMNARIESLTASKQQHSLPAAKVEANEIIPENSINYLA